VGEKGDAGDAFHLPKNGGFKMIFKEDFLNKLRHHFSLNLYEVRLWTALLSRGVSTAGELSDIANVPRSRSYDVLESLEKKGFVIQKFGKPIKYMAVAPEEVVDRVKKHMKRVSEERISRLDVVREGELMGELTSLHSQGIELVDPTDLSGSLKGRHNLYNHLDLMIKEAQNNVSIMTSSSGLLRKLEGLKGSLEKAHKKGVNIRIAAPLDEATKKAVSDLKGLAEIRHSDNPARFVIVDGNQLTFMVTDDKEVHPTYDIGIWVKTPLFANALQNLFDMAWQDMKPIQ
jgi:HTH-type transcriptional regulator, sugar sensing transcriptional regulator